MSMFHPELESFIHLIERSEDLGDGWRSYTRATRPLVMRIMEYFPGLFVVRTVDDVMQVRMTDECKIVWKWMNHGKRKN